MCVFGQDLSQINIGTNWTDSSFVQYVFSRCRNASDFLRWFAYGKMFCSSSSCSLTRNLFSLSSVCFFFLLCRNFLATTYWMDSSGDNIFSSDSLCRYLRLFYTFRNGSERRILVNSFKIWSGNFIWLRFFFVSMIVNTIQDFQPKKKTIHWLYCSCILFSMRCSVNLSLCAAEIYYLYSLNEETD